MSKFKLVYEKDKVIKGTYTGIPADSDVELVDLKDYEDAGIKLVYEKAGEIYASTDNLPSEDDEQVISVAALEGEESPVPPVPPVPTGLDNFVAGSYAGGLIIDPTAMSNDEIKAIVDQIEIPDDPPYAKIISEVTGSTLIAGVFYDDNKENKYLMFQVAATYAIVWSPVATSAGGVEVQAGWQDAATGSPVAITEITEFPLTSQGNLYPIYIDYVDSNIAGLNGKCIGSMKLTTEVESINVDDVISADGLAVDYNYSATDINSYLDTLSLSSGPAVLVSGHKEGGETEAIISAVPVTYDGHEEGTVDNIGLIIADQEKPIYMKDWYLDAGFIPGWQIVDPTLVAPTTGIVEAFNTYLDGSSVTIDSIDSSFAALNGNAIGKSIQN